MVLRDDTMFHLVSKFVVSIFSGFDVYCNASCTWRMCNNTQEVEPRSKNNTLATSSGMFHAYDDLIRQVCESLKYCISFLTVFHVVHLEAPSQGDPAEVVPEAMNPAAAPDVLVDVEFHEDDVPLDIQVLHPAAVVVAGPSNRVVNIPHPADVDEEQERGRHRRVRPRNNPR